MAIHSMTGFGRSVHAGEPWHASIEISSVNRKQIELVFACSREWSALEGKVRQIILESVSRGRIQVHLHMARGTQEMRHVALDLPMAKALEQSFQELSRELGRDLSLQAHDFLSVPGIIRWEEGQIDMDQAWRCVEPALRQALESFHASRKSEGQALEADLLQRIGALHALLEQVKIVATGRTARYAQLLQKRLAELDCPISADDERVGKEIALYADRCDTSEEITRLSIHLSKFEQDLRDAETPGRSLDFLCQEIHREWNTIGSKAMDAEISQMVVAAKAELEKIREQVQNIE